jgi:hypothetical protein
MLSPLLLRCRSRLVVGPFLWTVSVHPNHIIVGAGAPVVQQPFRGVAHVSGAQDNYHRQRRPQPQPPMPQQQQQQQSTNSTIARMNSTASLNNRGPTVGNRNLSTESQHNDISTKQLPSLYRRLLRLHSKYLPQSLRELGNTYIQSEFRSIQKKTSVTPVQMEAFMTGWERYAQQILQQHQHHHQQRTQQQPPDDNDHHRVLQEPNDLHSHSIQFGQDLDPQLPLTSEQQQQLEKLRQETIRAAATNTGRK